MTIPKIQATEVFEFLIDSYQKKPRGIILEGGSRSSKTYSIIQFIVLYCQVNQGKRITIARTKFTWLQASVIQDFIDVLQSMNLYSKSLHRQDKSQYTYKLNNNRIYFVGLDDKQRLHGLKHDLFWINEAIESDKDTFDQLNMRGAEMFILDYNPAKIEHYIYKLIEDKHVLFMRSTQLNNPFLPESQRKVILSYEPTPENIAKGSADLVKWKVYGLGERAQYEGNVFTNWKSFEVWPEEYKFIAYGVDLGFNDPSVLVKVMFTGHAFYVAELIYESGLTTDVFLNKILELNEINKNYLICENDKTFIINARKAGLQAMQALKKPNSIYEGIQLMKKYPIFLQSRSTNAWHEYASYTWRENVSYNGGYNSSRYLDEPIDSNNHFMDSFRYVCYYFSYGMRKI